MYVPLRQAHDLLPHRALLISETRNPKPRCLSVFLRSERGPDDVLDDFAAVAGDGYFWVGTETAHEGKARELGWSRRSECPRESGRVG